MAATTYDTTLRLPADVGRIVVDHPEFRYLGSLGQVKMDWVRKTSDNTLFLEFSTENPEDAKRIMSFAQRVAGDLLEVSAITDGRTDAPG